MMMMMMMMMMMIIIIIIMKTKITMNGAKTAQGIFFKITRHDIALSISEKRWQSLRWKLVSLCAKL